MATIAVIGTLDSKGEEHSFVADCIREQGHAILLIDVGSGGKPTVQPDVDRFEVARAAGIDLSPLLARADRAECVAAMAIAAPALLLKLQREGRIDGVISLGGGGGTAIASAAMRALPIGFPKVMVSTLASGNTAHYVGTKDIVMIPSVLDVAGLNRISKLIFAQAAGAICGMLHASPMGGSERPLIAASMFGNTTDCVGIAQAEMEKEGFEVLVFHATGTGGRGMEDLIRSGMFDGVLDITTTEWADELLGGSLSAGSDGCSRRSWRAHGCGPRLPGHGQLRRARFGARALCRTTLLSSQPASHLDADNTKGVRRVGSHSGRENQCVHRTRHRVDSRARRERDWNRGWVLL